MKYHKPEEGKGCWQKREWAVLLVCFALAFLVNTYAVIRYGTPWTELFSQIGFVIIISLAFYIITVGVRLLWWLIIPSARRTR